MIEIIDYNNLEITYFGLDLAIISSGICSFGIKKSIKVSIEVNGFKKDVKLEMEDCPEILNSIKDSIIKKLSQE